MDTRLVQHIDAIRSLVLEMGRLSGIAYDKALTALTERDAKLAEEVIDEDGAINKLECDIDEKVLQALALEQPVAVDLRAIVGSARIAANLERVGDEAANICERVIILAYRPALEHMDEMFELAHLAKQMLHASLKAYRNNDAEGALAVCDSERKAEELSMRLLSRHSAAMVDERRTIERGIHAIMAGRNLERVANQAANVAENVVFMLQGVNMKHRCGRI